VGNLKIEFYNIAEKKNARGCARMNREVERGEFGSKASDWYIGTSIQASGQEVYYASGITVKRFEVFEWTSDERSIFI
jgi:hypothetical protein